MPDKEKDVSGTFNEGRDADERPHATIDLKATEVSVDKPEEGQEREQAGEPGRQSETADKTAEAAAQAEEGPAGAEEEHPERAESSAEAPHPAAATARDVGRFFTHLAAGLLGGLIALVTGYYALEGFRDRLPFVSELSVSELKSAQRALGERVAVLEKNSGGAAEQLAGRIEALGRRVDELARTAIAEQAETLKALGQRIAQLETTRPGTTAEARSAALSSRIEPIEARLEDLAEKVAGLERTVGQLEARQKRSLAEAKATALAVALTNLRQAIERGEAYGDALDAVKQLAPVELDTTVLESHREAGVATLDTLQQSFGDYAEKALEVARAQKDSSLVGRLVASARSIVRVRPTGMVEGDTPEAIIARMETRVKAGDLAAAIEESKKLVGEPAVVLQAWLDRAQARVAIDAALGRIESELLAALESAGAGDHSDKS